jgi:hypothetical protein
LLLLLLLLLIPVASCVHLRFIVVCFWPSCVGPPSLIVRVPITGEHEWGTHVLCQKIYNSTRCTYIFAFPTLQPFLWVIRKLREAEWWRQQRWWLQVGCRIDELMRVSFAMFHMKKMQLINK